MPNFNDKTAIIIPIRMSSSRLPGKFHADINGKPMIHHVIDRARESSYSNIFVACDHEDHVNLVNLYGIRAIMTDKNHQSGSDRSFEAINIIDPEKKFEYIINLQGDMPFFDPNVISTVARQIASDSKADIATIACPITDLEDIHDINAVKVIFNKNQHAIYFSRLPIPYAMTEAQSKYFYHIGIYGYRREALEKYVNLPQSDLELSERLEQLRALENGMIIRVDLSENIPISVDTSSDLAYANEYARKRII